MGWLFKGCFDEKKSETEVTTTCIQWNDYTAQIDGKRKARIAFRRDVALASNHYGAFHGIQDNAGNGNTRISAGARIFRTNRFIS
ncbi:hypothetical protein EFB08_19130 [Rufibacter latericius]|uniref:Uncharacterized protein n=1 Tax=Rufibacter latericius TaxID=2487040 RepID=A0A3M9MDJ5_9BACT|nr:hypothetical protein EFB08_19130 [Rufibacter latericius]